MRAHAQPHLRADLPAYISSCHTHSGSLTNWLSTEDVQHLQQVRQTGSFLIRLQVSIFILFCTLAGATARRSHLNRSCIPGPRQASRWPRESAAPAYRITSRGPGHGSFISKRPSGTTRVCFPTSAPRLLRGHPRRALISDLWSGFGFGFALGSQGPVTPPRPRTLLSARSRRSAVPAAVALGVSRGHTERFFRPPVVPALPLLPPRRRGEVRRLRAPSFGFVLA